MFTCASLFTLAKYKVRKVYRDHWAETNILPKKIQKELLEEWLGCEESMDSVTPLLEDASWRDLQPITPQTFVWLMSHPLEIPGFAFENNHIVLDFYIRVTFDNKYDNDGYRLCSDCFPRLSKYYQPYSANVWLKNNWVFKNIKTHFVIKGDDLLENVIWDSKYWCDECTCAPLFNILDYWQCEDIYDYHVHGKRRWLYDSDDSEDEPVSRHHVTPIIGNRVSDTRFDEMLRLNMIEQ